MQFERPVRSPTPRATTSLPLSNLMPEPVIAASSMMVSELRPPPTSGVQQPVSYEPGNPGPQRRPPSSQHKEDAQNRPPVKGHVPRALPKLLIPHPPPNLPGLPTSGFDHIPYQVVDIDEHATEPPLPGETPTAAGPPPGDRCRKKTVPHRMHRPTPLRGGRCTGCSAKTGRQPRRCPTHPRGARRARRPYRPTPA